MKRNFVAALIVMLCFVAMQAFAQTAFNTGSIYGKASDANGPLPGVNVTLEGEGAAPRTATTTNRCSVSIRTSSKSRILDLVCDG